MKKIGIMLFLMTLAIGLVITNIFSFGQTSSRFFNLSLNFGRIAGSGKIATDKRDVSGFKGIDVGGIFQVQVTAQKDFGVEVEADDNLLSHVRTEVRDGVLSISSDGRLAPTGPIKVRVSAPDIDRLEVSGVAKVDATGIKSDSLVVDSSGASKVEIAGEAAKLELESSGAAKIDAGALNVGDANIDASGASHVAVNVAGSLNAEATGASNIVYAGTPSSIEQKTSGAGRVSRR